MNRFRIGQGYDVHAICEGNGIILGGVKIPASFGLDGFSDADVLSHALTDALLGALALGDIGDHFPPGREENRNRDSLEFLDFAIKRLRQEGYELANADCTVICEAPKISPHRELISESLAKCLSVNSDQVSIKATTTEKLGFTGRGEGIAALAVVLIYSV